MWQLEQGVREGMGPSQGTALVMQHPGCPESGTGSRREPEDSQAPPVESLPSETRGTALSPGSPWSGGRNTQESPWLRVGIGSMSGEDFNRL